MRRVRRDDDAVSSWVRRLTGPGGESPPSYAELRELHRGTLAQVLLLAEAEEADQKQLAPGQGPGPRATSCSGTSPTSRPRRVSHRPPRPRTAADRAIEVVKGAGRRHCRVHRARHRPNPPSTDPLAVALNAASRARLPARPPGGAVVEEGHRPRWSASPRRPNSAGGAAAGAEGGYLISEPGEGVRRVTDGKPRPSARPPGRV